MIASHYAEPVRRLLRVSAPLLSDASADAEVIREVSAGEPFEMLDDSVGWAWGYVGKDRRVGYVRSDALAS